MFVCFDNEKFVFRVTATLLGSARHSDQPRPSSSLNPKIVLIKVVGYDSMMIKIPIIGGLTHCLASRELQIEVCTCVANANTR